MFSIIPAAEFLHTNFQKEQKSPKFTQFAKQFSRWSNLACSEILKHQDLESRVVMLEYFINVATSSIEVSHNYNASSAIFSGLSHPSISRLRETWKRFFFFIFFYFYFFMIYFFLFIYFLFFFVRLNKSTLQKYNSLESLWSVTENYRNYRTVYSKHPASTIPFLGMTTKVKVFCFFIV